MRDLGVVGMNADRDHILLRSDTGEHFRIAVDAALRDALRASSGGAHWGDWARLEKVETSMDGPGSAFPAAVRPALRPRDIQARIRAGESPEAVAAVAEVPVERIMAYAVPVLAERDHVCQQARRAGLRRKHASGPGRPLGQAVDEHLRGNGWNPEQASWDSWRREDGRWSVTVSASRDGEPATFLFDQPGRYAFAHDDAARRLVGDEPPLSVEPEPDEPRTVRPVPALPEAETGPALSPDMAALDAEAALGAAAEGAAEVVGGRSSALDRLRRSRQQTNELPFQSDPADSAGDDDVEAIARVMSVPPREPTASKRKPRRASVPSWDEIMFGSKPNG